MTNWHSQKYVIAKKLSSNSFRIVTRTEKSGYPSGNTIFVSVPPSQMLIQYLKNKKYLVISSWWYKKNCFTFDQCMTAEDELKIKRYYTKSKDLNTFFGGLK